MQIEPQRFYSSARQFEEAAGYCRTVKVGPFLWVSGTTATDENGVVVGAGDITQQTVQACLNVERALREAGADVRHVVRTTMYVVNLRENADVVATVHKEFFGDHRPAATMVGVESLYREEMLFELQVDAFIPEEWFEVKSDQLAEAEAV